MATSEETVRKWRLWVHDPRALLRHRSLRAPAGNLRPPPRRIPRLEHVGVLAVEAQIEDGDARPRGGLRGEREGGQEAGQTHDETTPGHGDLSMGTTGSVI